MGLLGRRRVYDRRRILDEAARAMAKGRRRRAISLYRWVLAVERHNGELHARLGPLLAETGQTFDAWQSYRLTARAALRDNRPDHALAVYREAAHRLPQEIQAWLALARLLERHGREKDAVEALLEGSRHFRTPWARPQAIHLLQRARAISAWDFETVLELARLLGRCDQGEEARILLGELSRQVGGKRLKRVRAAQLRLDADFGSLWRWLRATVRPEEEPAGAPAAAGVVSLRARAARR